MPGFGDTTFIVLLALLLFGPKKLPVLARQFGKLMGDFRRASNEFRTQMEEELRISEQADRQKQIAAMEATAPKAAEPIPEPEHPHLPQAMVAENTISTAEADAVSAEGAPVQELAPAPEETTPAPMPIASSGDLNLMPPSTGLPIASTYGSGREAEVVALEREATESHVSSNGSGHEHAAEEEARPWRI